MSQADAFEQAILANPEDITCRLAYADWLEERGDIRGEYLRVEAELAKDETGSQGHAMLRQRVDELRRRVDLAWGTTFGLIRITGIEDLVYYLRHFHRHWMESPGLEPASIPDDLPPGLALIYQELGGLVAMTDPSRNPFGTQDYLCGLTELRLIDGMTEFAGENQGNWTCRYPPGQEDPPVYSNAADVWESPRKGYLKVCDSLNHFLITLCLHEAVFSARCLWTVDDQSVPLPACRSLWMHRQYVYPDQDHSFVDLPGQDVLVMDEATYWVGSQSDTVPLLTRGSVRRIH
jgi:uncharacterized protein (TIGR02996 family)